MLFRSVIQTISNAMTEQKIGAEENLKATTLVVDDSDKIKSLVLEQRQHTENVELAMKSVVGSSKQVLAAIDECSSASVNLGNILSDIEDMIKENRQAVEQMETQINSFQFQSNKVDSNEEQESEDFGVEVLDFAEEVPEEVIEEKPVETAKTETLSTEDFFATASISAASTVIWMSSFFVENSKSPLSISFFIFLRPRMIASRSLPFMIFCAASIFA